MKQDEIKLGHVYVGGSGTMRKVKKITHFEVLDLPSVVQWSAYPEDDEDEESLDTPLKSFAHWALHDELSCDTLNRNDETELYEEDVSGNDELDSETQERIASLVQDFCDGLVEPITKLLTEALGTMKNR